MEMSITMKILERDDDFHKKYYSDEAQVYSLTRSRNSPIIDDTGDALFDSKGKILLQKNEYEMSDEDYRKECISKLNGNMFQRFLHNSSFTIDFDVKNSVVDTLEFDKKFLDPKSEMYREGINSYFLIAYENDMPLGSVNIFTSTNYPEFLGFIGIKKSPQLILSNSSKGLSNLLIDYCFSLMRMRNITTLVIPSPLESMEKILDRKGFMKVEGTYEKSRMEKFKKPVCCLPLYYYIVIK